MPDWGELAPVYVAALGVEQTADNQEFLASRRALPRINRLPRLAVIVSI
jgi:hypothetical protein